MRLNKFCTSILSGILTVALVAPTISYGQTVSGLTPVTKQNLPNTEDTLFTDSLEEGLEDWRNQIDQMLAEGKYVEGEVIVGINNLSPYADSTDVPIKSTMKEETLCYFSRNDVEEAYGEGAIDIIPSKKYSVEAARTLTIECISDPTKTTRELLLQLEEDPTVVMATPNYLYDNKEDATETVYDEADTEISSYPFSTEYKEIPYGNGEGEIGDLSQLQWAFTDENVGVHAPNWNKTGKTNVQSQDDKPMVIAVMDSGIDYTHPDLQSVMMTDMDTYSSMGGPYGYNAGDPHNPTEIMDHYGHGTMCAGIIAAAWDGVGISGIASGVKLCGVKLSDTGLFPAENIIKGFAYLLDAARHGLNLVAVNMSYGGKLTDPFTYMFGHELAQYGVVMSVSSSNDSHNHDYFNYDNFSNNQVDNMLIVNSISSYGIRSDFSSYGLQSTDLYAPGEGILSTTCQENSSYFPFVDRKSQLFYEGFDATDSKEWKDLFDGYGEVVEGDSVDGDGYSYKMTLTGTHNFDLCIPRQGADLSSIAAVGLSIKSDEPIEAFLLSAVYNGTNWDYGPQYGTLTVSPYWGELSYSYAMNQMEEGVDYVIEDSYIGVSLLLRSASDAPYTVYLDGLGLGDTLARYGTADGTSFSTPAVTGAVAVVASELSKKKAFRNLSKPEQAKKIVETIKASVKKNENLIGFCSSGGTLDLSALNQKQNTTIKKVSQNKDGNLVITGKYFGADLHHAPMVTLDENVCEVISWSDCKLVVRLPKETESGLHLIKVESCDGSDYDMVRTILRTDTGIPEFEYNIPNNENIFNLDYVRLTGTNGKIYEAPLELDGAHPCYRTMYVYDTLNQTWEKSLELPFAKDQKEACEYLEMSAYDNKVVLYTQYKTKSNGIGVTLWIYDTELDRFIPIDTGKAEVPSYAVMVMSEDGIILTDGFFSKNYRYGSEIKTKEMPADNKDFLLISYKYNKDKTKAKGTIKSVGKYCDASAEVASFENAMQILNECAYVFRGLSAYADTLVYRDKTELHWYEWNENHSEIIPKRVMELNRLQGDEFETSKAEISCISGALTAKGYMLTGLCAEDYDTVLIQKDGSISRHQSRLSYASTMLTSSFSMDDTFYSYGLSVFEEDNHVFKSTSLSELKDTVKHKFVKTKAVKPTYTSGGNKAYYTCSVCGRVYEDKRGTKPTTVKKCMLKKLPQIKQTLKVTAKKKTIKKGEKITLKVTGAKTKVTYQSSDATVASVSSKGVVKAKKAGTVKITITAKGSTKYKKATKTITIKVTKK